jgi:hypothetical protein
MRMSAFGPYIRPALRSWLRYVCRRSMNGWTLFS